MPFGLGFFATAGVSAAAGSYELIESTILTGAQASVTFSNLGNYSTTYKHLQIRAVARSSRGVSFNEDDVLLRMNGDSGTNYNTHNLRGLQGSVQSGSTTNSSQIEIGSIPAGNQGASLFGAFVIDILDPYGSKNKTTRSLYGDSQAGTPQVGLYSGAWRNTTSLTSITLLTRFAGYTSGSRFSLYGIKG